MSVAVGICNKIQVILLLLKCLLNDLLSLHRLDKFHEIDFGLKDSCLYI